jgi:RluA family pseudouridine synthase
MTIPVLYEESFFAVIDKPSGLFTQAPDSVPSVETVLRHQWATPGGPQPFVGLPHRLDRGTSGVLIVAKNQRALQRLGEQFHSRKINKKYLAAVRGVPTERSGQWIDFVRKIPDRPVAEISRAGEEGAKEAILNYRLIASESNISILEIELLTGRMHQIRIQLSSRGLSVLGDWCYGSTDVWGDVDERGERISLALHAATIHFRNPQNAKPIFVKAPLPKLWHENLSSSLLAQVVS